uniref:Uncharacterized protein n=1 Tax=Arundo donax TaxID=35708 RepID=A0A0A9GQ47_ARUDO
MCCLILGRVFLFELWTEKLNCSFLKLLLTMPSNLKATFFFLFCAEHLIVICLITL